jgi:hydroxyacylglutathione hydrolase
MVDFEAGAPVSGDLDVRWNHGARPARRDTDQPIQVHAYDEHTFVLRQNMAVHYEAPFLYLLFGNKRALLLDTGATADSGLFPLRGTVDALVAKWLAEHPRTGYELIVVHSHAHSDHVAGDSQFDGRPDTTVVLANLDSVQSFFGFSAWPDETVEFDLGGRVLEITGIPGHHDASIAAYDRWSGFLLTGDTVYPGRLYVNDFPAFIASLDRLVRIAGSRPVTHVMGCHIEMSRRPGRDYPIWGTYQPDEPPLQMTVAQLGKVREAAIAITERPGVHVFDNFVIFHGPCRRSMPKYLAKAAWARLRSRLV